MMEGKCPKCGKNYFGWALQNPRNQSCIKCGTGLLIVENGKQPVLGYSPFSAKEYKLQTPSQPTPKPEKDKLAI
jgi:ssDNA-binding Zn-finger/Zn-ribbon topoisomerase 1